MNETIYMPVGEVCSSISDTYREKKNMVTLINTSDVLEGRVLNHERVPNSNLKGQFKKTFQRDDILYSEIRPQNRRFAYVDFSPIDYIASTKLMVIRAKKDVVSPKYLYYFLKNSSTVAELQLLAETRSGTFPQITFSEVANLKMINNTLLENEVPPQKQKEFLTAQASQLDKLDFLMQAMIKTSRLETGVISLDQKQQPVYDTLATALGWILFNAEKKQIDVQVECPEHLDARHDRKWTSEALFNILDNAVKYTPAGGQIRVSVEGWEMYVKINLFCFPAPKVVPIFPQN